MDIETPPSAILKKYIVSKYTFEQKDLTRPLKQTYDLIKYSGPDFKIMEVYPEKIQLILMINQIEKAHDHFSSIFKIIRNCIDALNPQGLLQISPHTLYEWFFIQKWLSEQKELNVSIRYQKQLKSGEINPTDNTQSNHVGWIVLQKVLSIKKTLSRI